MGPWYESSSGTSRGGARRAPDQVRFPAKDDQSGTGTVRQQRGPALFLRLHADAVAALGFVVVVADRAGRAHGMVGLPLPVRRRSAAWAQAIELEIAANLASQGIQSRGVHADVQTSFGAQQGALTGSIVRRLPIVLDDLVFVKVWRDSRFTQSDACHEAIVDAIARGVLSRLRRRASR